MKLLYLTETNLRDRLFIRDLVSNFKLEEKAILIHDTFGGTIRDTRFVTKRISALMSESMIYNNAFSAEQRDMFSFDNDDNLLVNSPFIDKLLPTIQLLIIGPVIKKAGESQLIHALELVKASRQQLPVSETIVFTDNPLSPLGAKNAIISNQSEAEKWTGVYEEEKNAIQLALELYPARLASPMNYSS
ncbi:MAG: hypothetical protein KDD99_32205 [Bacteroidetes bacterium]|nr:hypothetical protein [Bacteroidota bacterium]